MGGVVILLTLSQAYPFPPEWFGGSPMALTQTDPFGIGSYAGINPWFQASDPTAATVGLSNPFGFGYYGYQTPYAQSVAAPRPNFMWLCLEDIFPQAVSLQAGLPPKAAQALSTYATHAYVMIGPSLQESVAWQFSLDEGQEYWMRVLDTARGMDPDNIVKWGENTAARVEGRAKVSSASGPFVFQHSEKCFRTSHPVKCAHQDLQSFTASYVAQHSRFNLLQNNCAMYACSALQTCGADPCDVGQCSKKIMYEPMQGKNPDCALAPEAKGVANIFGMPGQAMADSSAMLREMMPMHDPEVLVKVRAMAAAAAAH